MGWTPEEDFKGDPEKWISAPDFVKRAETELPIALGTIKNLERRLIKTEGRFDEVSATLKRVVGHFETSLEKERFKAATEYQRGLEDAQGRMREAAVDGDVAAFDEAKADADRIAKDAAELNKKPDESPDSTKVKPDPEFTRKWTEKNPWLLTEFEMYKVAFDFCEWASKFHPGWSPDEQMEKATEKVKEKFPDYFSNGSRKRPSTVDIGDRTAAPGGKGSKKSYNDLPPIAKQMCDDLCRDMKGYTKEKYMATYSGPWKE
jgi:hypothetical protein